MPASSASPCVRAAPTCNQADSFAIIRGGHLRFCACSALSRWPQHWRYRQLVQPVTATWPPPSAVRMDLLGRAKRILGDMQHKYPRRGVAPCPSAVAIRLTAPGVVNGIYPISPCSMSPPEGFVVRRDGGGLTLRGAAGTHGGGLNRLKRSAFTAVFQHVHAADRAIRFQLRCIGRPCEGVGGVKLSGSPGPDHFLDLRMKAVRGRSPSGKESPDASMQAGIRCSPCSAMDGGMLAETRPRIASRLCPVLP